MGFLTPPRRIEKPLLHKAEDQQLVEEIRRRFARQTNRENHLFIDLRTVRHHLADSLDSAVRGADVEIGRWREAKIIEASSIERCLALLDSLIELHSST